MKNVEPIRAQIATIKDTAVQHSLTVDLDVAVKANDQASVDRVAVAAQAAADRQ